MAIDVPEAQPWKMAEYKQRKQGTGRVKLDPGCPASTGGPDALALGTAGYQLQQDKHAYYQRIILYTFNSI
jgi:hypothetical protein